MEEANKKELARQLRKSETKAEKKLWSELRGKQLEGIKFRRQEPLGDYIVDFVTFESDLVIEVDGGQHLENEADEKRDDWLSDQGFTVMRFWNNQVLGNTEGVLREIRRKVEELR